MTTNIDLQNLAKKYNIKLDYIIFKDQLRKFKPNLNIILNMSSSGHPGTHWVALRTFKDYVIYYDSFGIEPPEEVIRFADGKKIIYNDYQLEELDGINCGQLALFNLALPRVIKELL